MNYWKSRYGIYSDNKLTAGDTAHYELYPSTWNILVNLRKFIPFVLFQFDLFAVNAILQVDSNFRAIRKEAIFTR